MGRILNPIGGNDRKEDANMKMARRFMILLVFIGAIGYGVYYFGMNFVSEKAAAAVTDHLGSEEISMVKERAESIPEVQEWLEEGASADTETLPFTTKQEAAKVVIKKVGPSELKNMYNEYRNGVSEADVQHIADQLESKLSADEMLALKALAYQELNR